MLSIRCVRTTVDIADDVYHAVKDRARRERRSAGDVLSELARAALTAADRDEGPSELGFRILPRRGAVVSNELIDRLRSDDDE